MIKHRYYMGRHLVKLEAVMNNKSLIEHLEKGYVGNKECGYKVVKNGDKDVCPTRLLWTHKKRDKKECNFTQLKLFPFFHGNNRNNRKSRKIN
jgi:hypothetical protein